MLTKCNKCTYEYDEDGELLRTYFCTQCKYEEAMRYIFGTDANNIG